MACKATGGGSRQQQCVERQAELGKSLPKGLSPSGGNQFRWQPDRNLPLRISHFTKEEEGKCNVHCATNKLQFDFLEGGPGMLMMQQCTQSVQIVSQNNYIPYLNQSCLDITRKWINQLKCLTSSCSIEFPATECQVSPKMQQEINEQNEGKVQKIVLKKIRKCSSIKFPAPECQVST